MEILESKPPGTLWATPGQLRDCFNFTFSHHIWRIPIKSLCSCSHETRKVPIESRFVVPTTERAVKIPHTHLVLMLLWLKINTVLVQVQRTDYRNTFRFIFKIHRLFWHKVCGAAHHVSIVHAEGT